MKYTIGCTVGITSTVEECLKYFEDKPHVEVDTETTGRDPHVDSIISLQLGDHDNQWFIDCRPGKTDLMEFKELLESKLCLLQNAKFDYKMLKKRGIIIEHIYDTMLAECVIACGFEKWGYSLAALCKRYLELDLSKEERLGFIQVGDRDFTIEQVNYGCEDVAHLGDIRAHQLLRLRKFELEYCVDLENKAVKALADIEYNGMILDRDSWLEMTATNIKRLQQLEKELDACVAQEPKLKRYTLEVVQTNLFGAHERPTKINYASPVQILKMSHDLGYPIPNTNERELSKLAELHEETSEIISAKHRFFGLVLQNREVAKAVSTYGVAFLNYINKATGRVHTDFWQVLNTGRVSSGNKDMNAPNLQNLPAKNLYRNCFKARPGFKWVSIDYSGQELRIMADGSGEQGFIDVLNDKSKDLHCYAGEMMFKKPIDKKKDKALRDKAKKINFGKPYGMGPDKLSDMLRITKDEATELFRLYAEAFPVLNKWLEEQGKRAVTNHYSTTFFPCKRRRWYPKMKQASELRRNAKKGDKTTWREIMIIEGETQRNGGNQPIQGCAADITKEAMVMTRRLIQEYNVKYGEEVAFMICTVHDAIDFEVRADLAEQFARDAEELMKKAGRIYVKSVVMEVDTTISDMWMK